MPLKATERDVFEFFSQAGKVGEGYHENTFDLDDVEILLVFNLVISVHWEAFNNYILGLACFAPKLDQLLR